MRENCCVGDCLLQFSDLTPFSTWGVCRDGDVDRPRSRKRSPALMPLLVHPGRNLGQNGTVVHPFPCATSLTKVRAWQDSQVDSHNLVFGAPLSNLPFPRPWPGCHSAWPLVAGLCRIALPASDGPMVAKHGQRNRCDRDDLADSLRRTAQSRLYPSESSPLWLLVVGLERCDLSRQRSGVLGVF